MEDTSTLAVLDCGYPGVSLYHCNRLDNPCDGVGPMRGEVSSKPTPWGVHCTGAHELGPPCNGGKIIYLTRGEYNKQMNNPDALWKCPYCGYAAYWDDKNYEKAMT